MAGPDPDQGAGTGTALRGVSTDAVIDVGKGRGFSIRATIGRMIRKCAK